MYELDVEVENNKPAKKCRKIITNLDYESIMPRAAAKLLSQLEYWWSKKKGPEVYKTDQELAKETGMSERSVQYAKKYLSDHDIVLSTVHQKNGKSVTLATFYKPINYTNIQKLRSNKEGGKYKKPTLVTRKFCELLNRKVCGLDKPRNPQSLRVVSAKFAGYTLYTNITTNITYNTSCLEKYLSSNQSDLGNPSPDQKSGSEVDRSAFRGKINLEEPPTPSSEESKQEEKAVEPPTIPLKAKDVEAPKKSKANGKVSKPKSNKVAKTPINPEMELTPELRKIALDVRVDGRGLKEGYVDSEFKIFRNKYVGNQRKEERWDLKWEEWCTNVVGWDGYSKKSMVNPPRTTVSDKLAEGELPIDSAFENFLKSNPDINKDYFRGATLQRGEKVIIWHSDEDKADYMDDRYCRDLRGYFGPDVMVRLLSEEVKKSTSTQPVQTQPAFAQPIQLPIDDFNVCLEKMRMSAIAKLDEIEDEEERFMKLHKLERDIKYVKNTYTINHDILNIGLIDQKYGLGGLFDGNA